MHDPAENDEKWGYEKCNLHGAANRNVDGKIHFALVSDNDGGHVFSGVSDDGKEYKTDEGLGDVCGFDNGVDAGNQIIGAHGDQDGHKNERNAGSDWGQDCARFLFLWVL